MTVDKPPGPYNSPPRPVPAHTQRISKQTCSYTPSLPSLAAVTGRPASSIRLCAAKTLWDCSAVLRTLYKRQLKRLNKIKVYHLLLSVCQCTVVKCFLGPRPHRVYLRKYPGGKDAWGKALEEMLKESREVLLLLFFLLLPALFHVCHAGSFG